MKHRKQSSGRRGRRNRQHDTRCERHDIERQRLIEDWNRRRKVLLDRIMPRLRRFCPLSEIGVVEPRDGNLGDRQDFYSVDGRIRGRKNSNDGFVQQHFYAWDTLYIVELAELAKIKRFDPVVPKNAMVILAEAYAGLHEEL